jgi:hypothetical protein
VSLWTVLSVTDLKSEDEVLAAIDDGRILFAFNIAGKTAKSRLVRVLAASLCNFVEGTRFPKMSFEDEWKHVERLIFPVPAPTIPAKDAAIAWNCSTQHVIALCDQRLLRLAKGSPRHCGQGGSPQVEYQSAVQFLRARRVF